VGSDYNNVATTFGKTRGRSSADTQEHKNKNNNNNNNINHLDAILNGTAVGTRSAAGNYRTPSYGRHTLAIWNGVILARNSCGRICLWDR